MLCKQDKEEPHCVRAVFAEQAETCGHAKIRDDDSLFYCRLEDDGDGAIRIASDMHTSENEDGNH